MNERQRTTRRVRLGGSELTLIEGLLPNGAAYALWPDARDTVVTCQIWVAAGTADEPDGASGVAHMLEHLMFRGTPSVPDGEFDARMERLGVSVNAATWLDYTFYTSTCPPGALGEVLGLESDRFAELAITAEVFVPEREVVANERRQVIDDVPDARLAEILHGRALGGTAYEHPTIGLAEDIAAYSVEQVSSFYERHYTPENLCVVICGCVDLERTEAEVARTFGSLAPRAAPPRATAVRPPPGSRIEVPLPVASRRLLLAWPGPSRPAGEFAAWKLLTEILGQGESSRLVTRLDMRERKVFDIGASLCSLRLPGLFELSATLRPDAERGAVLDAIDKEITALAEGELDGDELEAARNRLRTVDATDLAETSGRAERMGESWIFFGRADRELEDVRLLERVSRDDVVRVAGALLDEAARTEVWGLPGGSVEASGP